MSESRINGQCKPFWRDGELVLDVSADRYGIVVGTVQSEDSFVTILWSNGAREQIHVTSTRLFRVVEDDIGCYIPAADLTSIIEFAISQGMPECNAECHCSWCEAGMPIQGCCDTWEVVIDWCNNHVESPEGFWWGLNRNGDFGLWPE